MKKGLFILALLIGGACISTILASNKVKQGRVYILGFAASFLDSIAYVTGIQSLDTGYIDTKTGFLLNRPEYSEQLHAYLTESKQMNNVICSVFFSEKKQRLEKTLSKLTFKTTNKEGLKLNALDTSDFHFQTIKYIAPTPEEEAALEAAQKAEKEAEKAAKKAAKEAKKKKKKD